LANYGRQWQIRKEKNKGKNAGDKWPITLLTGSNSIWLGRSEANLYF
jgi:hypothetical protein